MRTEPSETPAGSVQTGTNDHPRTGIPRRQFLRTSAAAGAAALLAACGGAPESTTTALSPAGQAGGTTAAASAQGTGASAAATGSTVAAGTSGQSLGGDVGLRFFPFGNGVEELYGEFAEQFQSQNPGVQVRLDLQPWENRYPKMLADLAAGQGPDVMFVTTDVLIRFVQANAIAPAGDLLPEQAWEGYSERAVEEVSLEGKRWFVPMEQQVPLWLSNTAIFEQAGLDPEKPPTTWDEIRDVCRAVKAADPGLYGWGYNAASPTLNTTFYPFLYQAGGRPIGDDGTEPTFNSDAGVEALSFIVELFEQGWASQQWLQPIEAGQDPFTQGKQAISIHLPASGLLTLRKTAPDLKYAITPVLKHKEQWGFGSLSSWAISGNSKNQQASAALANLLVEPETMVRHCEAFALFPVKEAAAAQVYKNDAELASLRERLPLIFGEQKHKYGRDLMPLVTPEIQAAILKQKTPKQALDDAAAAVRELFAKG